MTDDQKGFAILLTIVVVAIAVGVGLAPTKVERIHSPPGLIVLTPEGRKVFIHDSAILPEVPGK